MTSNVYQLPSLAYGLDELEPALSSELLELHHGKHHQGYVNNANATVEALADARKKGEFDKLKQLQKDLAFNVSGHVLHSIFWRNMSPDGGGKLPDSLKLRVADAFGGLDAMREQFIAAGTSIQGSGWAALGWEPESQMLIVEQVFDHQNNIAGGTLPVLVMDMWEHAYYLQYQNEKKRWAEAFWDLINWQDVDARLWRYQHADIRIDPQEAQELKKSAG